MPPWLVQSWPPKEYIWIRDLYLESVTLNKLNLVEFSKLDTLMRITLDSSVDTNKLEAYPKGAQNWSAIRDRLIVEPELHCKGILHNIVSSCKRFRWGTLVVGDTERNERRGRITGHLSFVDTIRGHRLQRWIVEAASGSSVIVRADSDSFDAVLYVELGDSVLYSDDDGPGTNSFLEFQMPDSGRVDVLAGSFRTDAAGEYSVRVGRPADLVDERSEPRGTLVVGDAAQSERQGRITGDLSFVDPTRGHRLQRWAVEAASGSSVIVRADSDSFDAVLYVELGDSVLYSDDDGPGTNSFLEFQMPDSGRVDVLAGSFRTDAEGEYSVRVTVGGRARLLLGAAGGSSVRTLDLTGGAGSSTARISGNAGFVDPIRGHRLQRWVVEADSGIRGSRVTVLAESDLFDAVLYVVLGDSVLYSDDGGPGTNSFLEFQMPDSGRVDVLAGSYSTDAEGEYSVRVTVGGRARLLLGAAGDSSVRTLDLTGGAGSSTARISGNAGFVDPIRGHRLQRWVVEADSGIRGSRVTVLAESDLFDAVLYVVLGDSVLYSDDGGPGTNSFLEFQIPDSGRVEVLAGSYSADAEGEYRLRVASAGSG